MFHIPILSKSSWSWDLVGLLLISEKEKKLRTFCNILLYIHICCTIMSEHNLIRSFEIILLRTLQMGRFCLVLESAQRGSVANGAPNFVSWENSWFRNTCSLFFKVSLCQCQVVFSCRNLVLHLPIPTGERRWKWNAQPSKTPRWKVNCEIVFALTFWRRK